MDAATLIAFVLTGMRVRGGYMSSVRLALDEYAERRAWPRSWVAVPASIRIGDQDYTAKLANIVHGGAMLETTVALDVGARATVHCGTIAAEAMVIWKEPGRVGVKFITPLTDAEVSEQLSRSAAIAARRAKTAQ